MLTASIEDHRVRVARERRERMVARLLQAVMDCYASHVLGGPPSVEEVIARADVSRATFYKYFNSIDEAIEQRAGELVEELIESLKGLVRPDMPPLLLFTISVLFFLLRSVLDPSWAVFVARSDLLRADGVLALGMTRHLAEAHADGRMHFASGDAARTVAVGIMREGMRAIPQMNGPRQDFVDEIMLMTLIGLGVARDTAGSLVAESTAFIRDAAPDRLSWWRDPWAPEAAS